MTFQCATNETNLRTICDVRKAYSLCFRVPRTLQHHHLSRKATAWNTCIVNRARPPKKNQHQSFQQMTKKDTFKFKWQKSTSSRSNHNSFSSGAKEESAWHRYTTIKSTWGQGRSGWMSKQNMGLLTRETTVRCLFPTDSYCIFFNHHHDHSLTLN